ncbi:Rieske 2Fe-2S domain-containing protein [Verticiella sediminum]|uniref:Rieske 2Fe-2S domain-containing protein n=1 Tax=Verticiella sediminum TaxID=1247510 RepID=A0A556ANQ9_9BURK|nr:Rieske 2Fe-2S domain-containing protein [Verticiella sediminum]TSH94520.1 Rieske 2Fe-2S domain-containing protein [Verticiella sediminum]
MTPIQPIPDSAIGNLILDDRQGGRFRVNRRVFTDDSILALERRKIFGKCWLYLGHESEVREPGSYIARDIVGRPIVLARDRDGQLHCYYNACTHRGATVCRQRAGKQRTFTCPYHAWVFDIQGKLVNIPGSDSMPQNCNADGSLNLARVERMESFRGFVFVCFDPDAEPLTDYLKGAADYLSYVADQGPQGMEIIGGAQEYSARANWKMLSENSVDGYHGMSTHSTYFDYLRGRDGTRIQRPPGGAGWTTDLGNGHMVSESIGEMAWGRPYARWVPGWGDDCRQEVEGIAAEIYRRLGPERGEVVVRGDRNMVIFPNLVVNDIMAVTVRTYYPSATGAMQINSWALAPIGESASSRDRRLRNFVEFLGPAGFATPDDVEMLESAQRGYAAGASAQAAWNDCSRGMFKDRPSKTDELQLRIFWRRWKQLMTGGSADQLQGP